MAGQQVPLFDFMVVRAPEPIDALVERRNYITHDAITGPRGETLRLLADSPLAARVYDLVTGDTRTRRDRLDVLLDVLLEQVPARLVFGARSRPDHLEDVDTRSRIVRHGKVHLLPERLADLDDSRTGPIPVLARCLREEARDAKPSVERLVRAAIAALGVPRVAGWVFIRGQHSPGGYRHLLGTLFDRLYLLYMLSRWTEVDLEEIVAGLRVLHVLEALAIDEMYRAGRNGTLSQDDRTTMTALATSFPALAGWDGRAEVPGLPLVTPATIVSYAEATPEIHPMFASLFWYLEPFNAIRPIGVGELRVVRQWLTGYRPGEISYIHNIMKGERRDRMQRRLEKATEEFSTTSSRVDENSKDVQSTDRFEVKAETENVIKSSLNVTANANLTYNNSTAMITASAGAGFGYTRSSEDHAKASQNFARDVVAKAVSRIETRTATARTSTLHLETEGVDNQTFSNVPGTGHISGMYRWVDKEYTAQVFKYGKRLMFEFLVPEPSAFWARARLEGYANEVDVPQAPTRPCAATASVVVDGKTLKWEDVNEKVYRTLAHTYDLSALPPPVATRLVPVRNQSDGTLVFGRDAGSDPEAGVRISGWPARIPGAERYTVTRLFLAGRVEFRKAYGPGDAVDADRRNLVFVQLDGSVVLRVDWTGSGVDNVGWWPDEPVEVAPDRRPTLAGDDTTLEISVQAAKALHLAVTVELTYSPEARDAWRSAVFAAALRQEQERVDARNRDAEQSYQVALARYRDRIAELRATPVDDLLTGTSEAANKAVIDEEIKKHCLALITRDFDADRADDVVSRLRDMGSRRVRSDVTHFATSEHLDVQCGVAPPATTVSYARTARNVDHPAMRIEKARSKGSTVQFLEQAFEWHHLSYVFYPYYWAPEPRWIELMNRSDPTDPTFAAFLRAGMARVLVAVTPYYERAVCHYLHTREPWSGKATSPAIGSRLFIPLYEELRKQTDDREGGDPDGEPWTFTVPTSLLYIEGSEDELPDYSADTDGDAGPHRARTPNGVPSDAVGRR